MVYINEEGAFHPRFAHCSNLSTTHQFTYQQGRSSSTGRMPAKNEILPETSPETKLGPGKDEQPTHDEEAYNEKLANVPGVGKDGDLGARWLASYSGNKSELTDVDSEAVRKRVNSPSVQPEMEADCQIDLFLLPVCGYIYFCQQLDKSSISFAAVFGLKTDANLT